MQGTFTISKINIKKMLATFGVGENAVNNLLSSMNKLNRNVNVISFVGMLEKIGLKQNEISNILRRIGIDDITIRDILNTFDEEKIESTFGKVVELRVE